MQYWDIITRSFRIPWNHKYLWLIAFFSGEGGGPGFSYSYNQRVSSTNPPPSPSQVQEQVTTWVTDHAGLIVLLVIIWLVLVVAFFILGAICEGATVRASAEHDADRQFGLGWAWRSGLGTMWAMVRFRLLLLAFSLPVILLWAGLGVGIVVAFVNQNGGAAVGLVLFGLLVLLVSIPFFLYIFFLNRLGARALVLEQLGAWDAIVRGHRLLFKRLGRTLLVWLLSIAVGIALGIAVGCVGAVLAIPFLIVGGALLATGSPAAVPLAVIAVIILLPISLVVGGFLSAQTSTYWTLAFRRLDLDPVPMPAYPLQPAPAPPQVTP